MKSWTLVLLLFTIACFSAYPQSVEVNLNFTKSFEKRQELAIAISENGQPSKTDKFSYMEYILDADVNNTYTLQLTSGADSILLFNIDPRSLVGRSQESQSFYEITFTASDIKSNQQTTWIFDSAESSFVKATVESRAKQKAKLKAEVEAMEDAAEIEEKRRVEIEQLEIERRQREADARRAEEQRIAEQERQEAEQKRKKEEAKAEAEKLRLEISEAAFEAERKRKAKEAYEAKQHALKQASAVAEAQKRERSEAIARMEEERKSLAVKDAGAVLSRTEEQFTETNNTTYQITIEREYMTYIYKKVVYNWGGIYYFRDDDSITKAVFELETKK